MKNYKKKYEKHRKLVGLKMRFSIVLLCLFVSSSNYVFAQSNWQVKGTVVDVGSKTSLPGVNVFVKGTTIGAITDDEGNYQLEVPSSESIIVFSFIGFISQEIQLHGRVELDVMLEEDDQLLNEVVAIGYGAIKKRDVTASISSIRSDDIANIPSSSPLESMKGQIAGVDINQTGGKPGQEASITIRGRRSISANKPPLVVVDGMPMSNGTQSISDISPSDIQSIEVLKDAAATAVYG